MDWQENASQRASNSSDASLRARGSGQLKVQNDQCTGAYLDPKRGRVFIRELLPQWEASRLQTTPRTRQEVAYDVRSLLIPAWGDKVLADVKHDHVQDWVNELATKMAAAAVATKHGSAAPVLPMVR
ncbi:hypothetical protein C6401_06065 [Arthrobacter woluwensis]|uniref:hypothetical protein n=1 Tax=Arthrobacter woluwensis TaxID=156980 RepID=UPI000D11C091|nr:hypothetical protein [Arthrobacter woluwensis]PSS44815.1 hypothetical protein C6401_06065 [Arthrobacter woluwensis]